MRKSFTVADTGILDKAIFYADYQHGFIAWLNGAELCRSPELFAQVPQLTDTALLAHTLFMPLGGIPERFEIDLNRFNNSIRKDTNILALQVVKWKNDEPVSIRPY